MKYLIIILLAALSAAIEAHGETLANQDNPTPVDGMGFCFDETCINSGMTEPVRPTKSPREIEDDFKQCLKDQEIPILNNLIIFEALVSPNQIHLIDEQFYQNCNRKDLSDDQIKKFRSDVRQFFIDNCLNSQGALHRRTPSAQKPKVPTQICH